MTTIRIPGLIDPHVHLREPGATHKEDWHSGTCAALAGGFTVVMDMPNNTPPVTDAQALAAKQHAAAAHAVCDYGIHFGAGEHNVESAAALAAQVTGLKMYLDQTFGPLRLDDLAPLMAHMQYFPHHIPVLCHAEGRTVAAAIFVAQLYERPVHICHVSRKEEIELIRAAKGKGIRVTCEVTPHHLFLTGEDGGTIGAGKCEVRPMIATSADVEALRANLDIVDCFATDHAPHTLFEKESANPPPGFPGLETALPLYLELVREGIITQADLVARCYDNPRRIFDVPEQPETWVEVDVDAEWTARGANMHTRAKWTPFDESVHALALVLGFPHSLSRLHALALFHLRALAAAPLLFLSLGRHRRGRRANDATMAAPYPFLPLMFTYTAFGLSISSALELPELLRGNGTPDVTITFGDVPDKLPAPTGQGVFYQVTPDQFLLHIPDTLRYLVSHGTQIEIAHLEGTPEALVRAHLLGSGFGALLHQRGALPIHGSAIATPRGAVVFAGRSGRGKSTLAWEMHRRGYAHLCDDVTVVGMQDGTLVVYPAFPQLNLWGDVLDQAGHARSELRRIHPAAQKYALPTRGAFHYAPLSLYALYELHTSNTNTLEITPLKGMAKLQVLTANTYRPRLVSAMGKRTDHFHLVTLAGQQILARTVIRPVTPYRLRELADSIEQDFAA